MLALIMLFSMLGTTPVFAVSEYYSKLGATDATVTLDETNPGTVTVSLAGTANMDVYGIQGDWDTKDSTGKLTLTDITTDISNMVFTGFNYADAPTGKVLWSDDSFDFPAVVQYGTKFLNATYKVAADTPSGTYTVRFKTITLTATDYNSYTDEVYYTAKITVINDSRTRSYTIRFGANEGTGGISPVTLPSGSTYTLPACTFTPPSGRQFRAWSVNGMEKYPGETIVVQSDITISAIWQDIPGTPVTQFYSVTAQAGAGGSISPAGISNVLQYSDITYTITPESGYEISDVIVDGVNIGLTASYTFERVTTNHSITAVFEKKETPPAVPIYTDVLSSAWYYGDVQFVTERGLMNGVGEGLFAPDTLTDRAMIVTVLWRMEGSPIQKTSADFFDVSDGMWYTDAVRWASANGIVNGYGNSLFGPTDKITREQVMAILHRYAAYKGKTDGTILPMLEAYTYSPWAEGDVFWAENNGLLNNMGIRVNNMTEKASRGEIAAYLHRFCLLLDES